MNNPNKINLISFYSYVLSNWVFIFHSIALQNTIEEEVNHDLTSIVTLIKVDILQRLLEEANYDRGKTQFLVEGFKLGFSLGYEGPHQQ